MVFVEELAERGLMGGLVWVLAALKVGDPGILVLNHLQSDDFSNFNFVQDRQKCLT